MQLEKNISYYECMCIDKSYHFQENILLDTLDINHLRYKCKSCNSTHLIHKKNLPLFLCTRYCLDDWYERCNRLNTNCILKKLCDHCISPQNGINLGCFWYCPTCDHYKLQYLNGQQVPCHDGNDEITPNGGIIDLSQPGLCKISYN